MGVCYSKEIPLYAEIFILNFYLFLFISSFIHKVCTYYAPLTKPDAKILASMNVPFFMELLLNMWGDKIAIWQLQGEIKSYHGFDLFSLGSYFPEEAMLELKSKW